MNVDVERGRDATAPKQTLDAFVLADGIICSHIVNFLTSLPLRLLSGRVHLSMCSLCLSHCYASPQPPQHVQVACNMQFTATTAKVFWMCSGRLGTGRLSLALFHKPATLARPGPASVSALALALAVTVGLGIWLQFVNFWYHNTNSKSETMNCETLCCNCN